MGIKRLLDYINFYYDRLKNFGKFDLKQSYKNNVGYIRSLQTNIKNVKRKFFIFSYIFVTLALCPFLKNYYIDFLSTESYSFYYIIFFLFLLNVILNKYIIVPTHNLIGIKNFFLYLKNFFLYLNLIFLKIKKFYIFFKNEIFFKNSFVIFLFKLIPNFLNYFTY